MINDLQICPTIMSQLCRTEKRYLTRDEIKAVAEWVKEGAFSSDCVRLYFWLSGPHEPENGLCFEVCLTRHEAFKVDDACYQLQIGR